MITKINFKGNYKQFKDVQTPHELKKYTLFYGMNGTGKSTLSRLFYILEEYKKNPDFNINNSKYYEIKNAELTYNTNPIDWDHLDNFYQNNNILVRVFNQDYIRRTINSQTNTECEAIFVLGQENKKLKDDLLYLQNEKQGLEHQKQEKIESKNQLTQPSFNSSEHARDIRTKLNKLTYPTELIKSSDLRSDHLETFLNQKNCSVLTDQQNNSYIQIIKNNKGYPELNSPKIEIDINSLIHDTKIILEQTVESKTIERLEQNQQLKRWVKEGYSEFSKNDNESPNPCPFCEQSITQEFWNTLSNAFTDQQAEFTKQIQILITTISEKKKIISSIDIIDSSQVYPTINYSVETIQNFQTATSNISSILAQLVDKLQAKKDSLDNSLDINIQYEDTNQQSITNYISMITFHNEEVKNSTSHFKTAKDALLCNEIAILQPIYSNYTTNKNAYDRQKSNIDKEIDTIDNSIRIKNTEIINKQQEIKRQNTNIEQINNALHKYMGHTSIKFIVAGTEDDITFRLVRLDESENIINNNEPVFLSEGETTLVAFIYFINQLENRDLNNQENQKNNYIIVIDDPITSMDIDFVYYIIGIIRDLLSKETENKLTYQFQQIVFMTHHFMFFRELWKILHGNRERNKKNLYQKDLSYYLLERNNKYLNINSLPDFYKKHDTEYLYIFQSLVSLKSVQNPDDYQLKYYAPNLCRKLLDIFIAFKYAHDGERFENEFNDKCESNLGFDYLTLKRYTDSGSHLERYDTTNNFNLIKDMPNKVLECIEILDKEHYDSMINKTSAKKQ